MLAPEAVPFLHHRGAVGHRRRGELDVARRPTREETAFIDIEAWGKRGEVISKYVTKGRPLFVEGYLKFDQWEDKASGQKRSKLKVVLENFQFIGSRDGAPAPADEAPSAPAPAAGAPKAKPPVDEDCPF